MKTYRLKNNFKASFNFIVNGQENRVLFSGGMRSPVHRNGYFCTSNVELQKVMESQSYFNKEYLLESDTTSKQVEPTEKPEPINEGEEIKKPEPVNPNGIVIPEVTTWMQGASYFRKQYPEKYNNTMKKADVLVAMKEYNVSFPNWT